MIDQRYCPPLRSRCKISIKLCDVGHMQAGSRLVQNVERLAPSRAATVLSASLMRCASPPDSVVEGCPSLI